MTSQSPHPRPSNAVPTPDCPVVELPGGTTAQEARTAMAVAAELLAREVPVRDIIIVARNLDRYEGPLTRAAVRHEIPPTVWTQLQLGETEPFRLCRTLCALFDAESLPMWMLLRPLANGWLPPNPTADWPFDVATLQEICHHAPDDNRSKADWQEWLMFASVDDERLAEYLSWVLDQAAEPDPGDVEGIFGQLLDRYRERLLPRQKQRDSPALLDTERTVRAVERMTELVERMEAKYANWLETNRASKSWETVGRMCDSFASQRAGRREHGNARALDIVEANDTWERTVPYVIAVGLADGIWPAQEQSLFPASLRQEILEGAHPLDTLAPSATWDEIREADQFADTVQAPTDALVVTRPTRCHDGTSFERSPLLGGLDVESADPGAVAALRSADRQLPPELAGVLPEEAASRTEVRL